MKILTKILVIAITFAVTSACWILGDPENPLVLTTIENVSPEVRGTPEVINISLTELKEEVQVLFGEGAEVVLTSESNILGLPGVVVIRLDSNVTKDLLSEPVFDNLVGVAGSIWPQLLPFVGILGLFSRRWRRHLGSSVKNLIPGAVGSGNTTWVQPISAATDLLRAVGLIHSTEQTKAIVENPEDGDVRVVLEG